MTSREQLSQPTFAPVTTSRATSPSRARSRSGSRPRSIRLGRTISANLSKVYSAQSFDDHNSYVDHPSGDPAERPYEQHEQHEQYEQHEQHKQHESDSDSNVDKSEKEQEQDLGTVDEVRYGIKDERDLEGQPDLRAEESQSAKMKDPNLVSWDGADDPMNPKNWSVRRKWAATFVVSSFTFISPVSSSMVAPALASLGKDLHINNETELALTLSVFVLAYAVGPLFLGPLSEVYGRVHVIQLANMFYLVWNLGCGFARNKGEMIAFRFLAGLGGSAPLAIGGAVLSDVWLPEQRGKAIAIYSLCPLLGPAVGPIAGGWIAQKTTWRWVFWSTTILDAAIQVAGLFFLQETYAPTLLSRKASKLRNDTGNEKLYTEFERPARKLTATLSQALVRPFRMLGTQPIIQVIAIYMAYLYGLMYLLLSTFPMLWQQRYGESVGIAGLNYISLGAGFFLGTQITAPINDRIYRRLKKKNNGVGRPEFRVPLMFLGSSLTPVGLFWYGWSAQAKVHWIMPNIGAAIFAAGTIISFQCMQTYIVDSYQRFAASGLAAAVVLRSLAGFGFPLFAHAMYAALGYGWGNSLLGFLAVGLGIPAPFVFWFFGEKLRMKSKFAAG